MWKQAASRKADSVNALIPHEWRIPSPPSNQEQVDITGSYVQQFLSAQEIEITEADAAFIAKKTASGEWTAVDVTKAFCHRAALAHQLLNCLHEIFFEDAIAHAQKLDEELASSKRPAGPLHGVPVSLKDQFHVRGVDTTMGYVGWIGTFQGEVGTGKDKVFESEMVRELRAAGAVLYCKTAVPHTLMSGETINNIIGYVWNPKNRNLSAGGSSGGEGALIGLKGSPLGFGTDIGGSIRIPSAFCGVFGIRPSAGRLPYEGMANSMDGQNSILSVVGPLASSVQSLRLAVQAILAQQPWLHDPLVLELPWRSKEEQLILDAAKGATGRLAFGVFTYDEVVAIHPPVARAVDIVVKTVEKLGHELVQWKPPSHDRIFQIGLKTWFYDSGADVQKAFELSGEPQASQVSSLYGAKGRPMDAVQIAENNVLKREIQKEYMDYWNSTQDQTGTGRPVDAIIAPCAPFAAARPNGYTYVGYTLFVNVLDYTSVVIPVTQVDKSIDKALDNFQPISELDKATQATYDPDIYDGAHVSVQLVGRRLQEEKMLAIAELLSDALAKT
ncbi:hypothetical protein FH972_001628 [Carpinus fangiana]|uniref:amidase n=1 Tax=Carpinus fangiana TaxID=176857 RepID=A0A5N6QCD0_9ROSI|nr:hypothetical protein FH972_001628 [Carpinus fangiana]